MWCEFSGQPSQSGGKIKGIVLLCLTLCLQIPSNEPQQKTYFQQTNYTFHLNLNRRDRMVVEFATTCAIIAYHHLSCEFEPIHGEVYSIKYYVIKFVSDLRQVCGFLWVLQFPPQK